MKRTQIAVLVNLLMINSGVLAGPWMVGGSIGYAVGSADSGELNDELANRDINATISDIDNSRVTTHIFAGYEYLPRWGVELAYVDLGDVSASINGTITGINNYFENGQDIYPQTATGWQVSSVYRYPISGLIQMSGRLGLYSWTTDYTLQTSSLSQKVKEDGTDISIGLGIEAGRWIKQGGFVGQVNWEHYSINGEAIDVLAVGVSYRF